MSVDRIVGLAAAAAFLVALPAGAQAQNQRALQIEARGGIAVPTGDLKDLQDAGPSFGAKLAYMITPRIGIRADGDVALLRGADLTDADGALFEGPDLTLYHYTGGLQFDLAPAQSQWSFVLNGGAGATTIDSERFEGALEEEQPDLLDYSETFFSANGGAQLGYNITERVNAFVGAQAYVIFADEEDTEALANLSPGVQPFDNVVNVPVHVGFNVWLR